MLKNQFEVKKVHLLGIETFVVFLEGKIITKFLSKPMADTFVMKNLYKKF